MPLYDPVLPARYVVPLLDFVREQKPARIADILRDSGIDGALLSEQQVTLSMRQLDLLLTATSNVLGRGDIGFELGLRLGVHNHEALGLALATCQTFDSLLSMYARFWKHVTTCFSVEYRRNAETLEWIVRPAAGMSQPTLWMMEELFAVSFHVDCARLLGGPKPLDIYLSMPVPAHVARYEALHPGRFHFDAHALPAVRGVLPASFADLAPKVPKIGAPADERQRLNSGLRDIPLAKRCGDWVALMLREAEGAQPSRRALAELLNLSPRTLTRALAAEGINFRKLSNEIRHRRACAMLATHGQPVTHIAFRLGYKDVTSFNHAFRSFGGMSPRDYRQKLKGGTVAIQ